MTENDIQAANQAEEGGPPHGWIEPLGTDLPSIQISELLHELKKNKTRVLQITLAVFLVVTVGAFLLPNEYTSSASFIPPSGVRAAPPRRLPARFSAMSGGNLLGGIKNSGDLYAGILRSRSIADRLVERFDLMKAYRVARKSDAVKRLGSNTTIDVGQKDSIVTVSVRDRSPERARDLANGYLDVLREKNGLLALSESSQRRLFFAQQLAKRKTIWRMPKLNWRRRKSSRV